MENLVALVRKIGLKSIDEFLFFLCAIFNSDYRIYRRIRRLVKNGRHSFYNAISVNSLRPIKKMGKQFFLWNNPLSGFSHQTSVYLMGFVIAHILDRTVILNYMRLNLYHNRHYDKIPRLCDPKIFFNWDKINEMVEVITMSDISNIQGIHHFSIENVFSIDLNRQYRSDLLLINNNRAWGFKVNRASHNKKIFKIFSNNTGHPDLSSNFCLKLKLVNYHRLRRWLEIIALEGALFHYVWIIRN